MNNTYRLYLLLTSIVGGFFLTSCNKEWTADNNGLSNEVPTDERQLVVHDVSVALDGVLSRVSYKDENEGLQLSWNADETLGAYIRKADNTIIFAGTMTSSGEAGDRGARRFSGNISQKGDNEQYIYIHPALTGETQGQAAKGNIDLITQSGTLGSTAHLTKYIPLIWHEGSSLVSNQGYAIHLKLTFNEDPGTISKVTLQTMPEVGETNIFPISFDASSMTASSTMKTEVSLTVSGTATNKGNGTWTADAYLACTHHDIDVFRTKFNAKVEASKGTFYNEFRSFPGQENANSISGLPMLANGKCYNLETAMTKGVATTVINSQYKVNSLLGMWNVFGKTTDPFSLVKNSDLPSQLTDNILGTDELKTSFMSRILSAKSSQGTPTFTWSLLEKQISGSSDGVKQTNVTYNNIQITKATEVYLTFISEYAWNQNLLGYYHYPTAEGNPTTPGNVLKTIIFPNVSKGGHVPFNRNGDDGGANINPNGSTKNIGDISDAPLQEFTTVQLLYNNPDGTYSTKFPAGTTIGFMMMRDTQASNGGTTGEDDSDTPEDHSNYSPRQDNTLINWNAWRLFTNTTWNQNNTGWYGRCWNYFVSGKVVGTNGAVIPGLAIYGVKDDADHNYEYSFSSMLFMVSTSDEEAMNVQVPGALNLGTDNLVIQP